MRKFAGEVSLFVLAVSLGILAMPWGAMLMMLFVRAIEDYCMWAWQIAGMN